MRRLTLLLVLAACAPAGPATAPKPRGNPVPPVSPALLARTGCDQKPALMQREALNYNLMVEPGMDACIALARYGRPYSAEFNALDGFETMLLMWNLGGGRLGAVHAMRFQDTPDNRRIGKANEIGWWRIHSVNGFEQY